MKHNYLSGIIVMFLLAFSPGLLQARQPAITPTSGGEEVSFENIVVQYLPATDTPITKADNQGYGVSWLRFVFDNDANVLLNKNCPSPAVLTKEGDADFRWEIKADATWSQTTLAYPMFGNSADGNNLQLAFFIDLSNKITGEGTYKFTIPDGYVTSNGVKVNGTTFTYIVSGEGGGPVVEQKEFKSLVKEYLPAVDTPLAIADNQFGVSWLRYVLNTKVTLNTGCTSPILLTKEGDESVRVEIPADATMQSSSKIYPMVVNYTDGSPMLTLMIDYQNPIKGAGTYTVTIPDGYVQCDGVDVKGAAFTYILQDEPVVAEKTFKDLVKQYLPAVDTPLAIADNQYGVSWLRYVLNTTVTLNKECASPAVLAKEGDASVRIEIPADAAYPAKIYPAMGASMEGDPQLAFMIDFQNPIVSAGTYTVTIPDGYVKCDGVDVKGSTFTYIIEAAPVAEKTLKELVTEYLPAVDTPLPVADNKYGVSWLRYRLTDFVTVNKECAAPAVLTREGDDSFRIEVSAAASSMGSNIYAATGWSGEIPQLTFMMDYQNAVTTPGTYCMTVPDGFLKLEDGTYVKGSTFKYILVGSTPVEPKEFKSLVKEYLPATDTPLQVSENQFGVSWLRYVLNTAVALNTECASPIVLTKDGDESVRVEIPADATMQSPSKIYPLIANYTDGSPMLTLMIDYQNPIVAAGTYTVTIPDGYLKCEGADVKGASLKYILEGEPVVVPKEFKNIVKEYLPAVDTPLDVKDNQYGVSWLRYVLNTTVTLNTECASPVVLVKEGDESVRVEVPANATSNSSAVYPAVGTVNDNCQLTLMMDYQNPIVAPGTYIVTIPDGYLKCNDVDVKGASLKYILEDSSVPTEKVFDKMVTRYQPPVGTRFEAVEENQLGVSQLTYIMNAPIALNTGCASPAVLTKEGDESFRKEVSAGASYTASCYPFVGSYNGKPQVMFMIEYQDAITEAGTYYFEIPDGYFTSEGESVKGAKFTYYLGVDPGPVVEPKVFTDMVTSYLPPVNTAFTAQDDFALGMSKIAFVLDAPVWLNTECTDPVVLTKDGDEAFRKEIKTDASRDDVNYTLISRKEGNNQVTFFIDQANPLTETGKYFLEIPDGFFAIDGTGVKGCRLEYNMNGFNSIDMIMLDENGNPAYRLDGTKAVKGEKGIIISRGKRVIVR